MGIRSNSNIRVVRGNISRSLTTPTVSEMGIGSQLAPLLRLEFPLRSNRGLPISDEVYNTLWNNILRSIKQVVGHLPPGIGNDYLVCFDGSGIRNDYELSISTNPGASEPYELSLALYCGRDGEDILTVKLVKTGMLLFANEGLGEPTADRSDKKKLLEFIRWIHEGNSIRKA